MTAEQWRNLKTGDYIRTISGRPRKILEKNDSSNAVVLASSGSRNGKTTVYCNGDRYLFGRVIPKKITYEDKD